jgi:hypothetical protein
MICIFPAHVHAGAKKPHVYSATKQLATFVFTKAKSQLNETNFLRFLVTSNLAAHAWNIKYI